MVDNLKIIIEGPDCCGKTYLNWCTRSIEDVCQMCQMTIDKAKDKK